MSLIKKIGVVLLSLLLIATLTTFILLLGFNELLKKETYTSSFEKNNFYSYLETVLTDAKIYDFLILEDGLKPTVDNKVDNCILYMKSERDDLDLKIKINRSKMIDSLTEKFDKMRECQIADIQKSSFDCRPPGVNSRELVNQMLISQNVSFENESDFDLSQLIGQDNKISEMRKFYNNYLILFYGSILVSLILAGLILILNIFNLKSALRTFGIIFVIVGLNALIFSNVFISVLISQSQKMITENPEIGFGVFFNVLKDILIVVGNKIKFTGIISLITGISLFVLSFLLFIFFRKKK